MTNNHDLNRMTIALSVIDMIAAKHPEMTMDAAVPALRAAIINATVEPMSNKMIEQAAAEIFASEAVQAELPPWE